MSTIVEIPCHRALWDALSTKVRYLIWLVAKTNCTLFIWCFSLLLFMHTINLWFHWKKYGVKWKCLFCCKNLNLFTRMWRTTSFQFDWNFTIFRLRAQWKCSHCKWICTNLPTNHGFRSLFSTVSPRKCCSKPTTGFACGWTESVPSTWNEYFRKLFR